MSFALGNYLLGVLDEKQHREREGDDNVGWYHKTDFDITVTIGGEDFHYDGRFDIGDGEGDLIAHIKNFYEYSLSPDCPFIPEWKSRARTITVRRWKVCVGGVMCLFRIWSSTKT